MLPRHFAFVLLMQKITAIEQQKRNKERVSIFLDGEFAFGLAYETAAGLRVGQELSEEAVAQLQDQETVVQARQSAFRFISFRPRSIAEVRRNLLGKQYDEALVEAILNDLVAREYLDDETFAAYWVEQRESFKPRSRVALRHELYEKGVPRAIIDKVVQDVDEDDAAIKAAARRAYRWFTLGEDEFTEKLIAYLRRRGFNYRIARKTAESAWRNQEENDTPAQRR